MTTKLVQFKTPTGEILGLQAVENADGSYSLAVDSAPGLQVAEATYTLPAGANAYSAKDVIADSTSAPHVLTFANMARAVGCGGYLMKARLLTDQTTFVARVRLHLYHTAPTAINDNAPFTALYANAGNRVGFIDFPAPATEGTGSTAALALLTPGNGGLPMPFKCDAADANLYGIAEVLDGFTSAATQHVYFELTADPD